MHKILFIFLFLAMLLPASPQNACEQNYKKYFERGKGYYNKGEYIKASKAFGAAHCWNNSAIEEHELDKWAKKCMNSINAACKSKKKKENVKPIGNPEVEFIYIDYLHTIYYDNLRGAALQLNVIAKNLKDNKLLIRGYIAPINGSGKVNESSTIASKYTLDGGLSGQEQEVLFPDGVECVSVTVFVPFDVMDFRGYYKKQCMKASVFAFQKGDEQPITQFSREYDSISPFEGRVASYTYNVNFRGGVMDSPDNMNLSSPLPYWIKMDEVGIHVSENNTSSPRIVSLNFFSANGEPFEINIIQKNREEEDTATATVKHVWLEQKMINPSQNLKQLDVHLECEISGAKGKEVTISVFFYCPDGKTPLVDAKGDQIIASDKAMLDYTESYFDNFVISMWFNDVTNAANNSIHAAKYIIRISLDDGRSWIKTSAPYTIEW